MITRRRFVKASAAAVGLGAVAGIYTWRIEPHWLEVVERRLSIAGLPQDLAGLQLVQLSDLHVGPRVDDDYLLRCFHRVKELAPAFVVYTGDFTSHEPQVFDHARRMFSHLPLGRRGTFGILGNHDYGLRWSQAHVAQQIADLATDAGVRVLRNEVVETAGLHVVGLDDLWADRFDLAAGLSTLPTGAAAIVLSHNPDTADVPGWGAYSGWILSGQSPPPLESACQLSFFLLSSSSGCWWA